MSGERLGYRRNRCVVAGRDHNSGHAEVSAVNLKPAAGPLDGVRS